MAGDLNNVSYVTLALIGDGGASPQDLVDMNRSGGQIYYAVAASRLYAEPKRLERLGYVSSEKRPGKTRERTFYTLTDKGREALRRWVLEPPALPRIQNEAVPKLMSGDILGDDEQLLASLLTLRDEIEGQQGEARRSPEAAGGAPAPEELPAAHPRAGRPAPPGPARVARRRGTGVAARDNRLLATPRATRRQAADPGDDFPLDRRSTRY